jgi:hypothetical protein
MKPHAMNREFRAALKPFLVELLVYALLVAGYYFLVLHFLGNGLKYLYEHERRYYAALALGLIIGQGFLLEILTRLLLAWFMPRREDG